MLENLRVLGGGSARAHLPRFFCSKCERVISHLECLALSGAPNARNFSGVCCRFCGFGKHLPVNFPAFVVGFAEADHICRKILRRLWSFWPRLMLAHPSP